MTIASISRARSRRYAKSGSTRLIPSMSAVGKRRPVSTTTIRPSYSTTVMFLPISPRPPSGRTRSLELLTRARSADRQADQVERRLDGARPGADAHVAVGVAQPRVDLTPVLRLVHHAPHLGAEHVAAGEDAAGPAHLEHVDQRLVIAGVQREPVDGGQVRRVGLLDPGDVIELGEFGQQIVRHDLAGPPGAVV